MMNAIISSIFTPRKAEPSYEYTPSPGRKSALVNKKLKRKSLPTDKRSTEIQRDEPATPVRAGQSTSAADDAEYEEFAFKRFLRHRWVGDVIEIEVEWEQGDPSWENEADLHRDAPETLLEYWDEQGGRPENPNDAELYNIFAILKHSPDRKSLLVEWVGYGPRDATWVPRTVVQQTAPDVVKNYFASLPKKRRRARRELGRDVRLNEQAHTAELRFTMDYLLKAVNYVQQCALRGGDVRVVCMSDTHSQRVGIPTGDILIHAGDLSKTGSLADIQETVSWLDAQPHAHKIVIAGNADLALETDPKAVAWGGVTYLEASSTSISVRGRSLSVYGNPNVPRCGPDGEEAFQYELGGDYWNDLLPQTDILVTHTPPKFILDVWSGVPEGCESLLKEVRRVKPSLHVFGHVHPAHGKEVMIWGTKCDTSAMRECWWKHAPFIWVKLVHVLVALWVSLEYTVKTRPAGKPTVLVNAACAAADGSYIANEPIVIDI